MNVQYVQIMQRTSPPLNGVSGCDRLVDVSPFGDVLLKVAIVCLLN